MGYPLEHVEWLDHEALLHAAVRNAVNGRVTIVARITGMRELKPGQAVRLGVEEGILHWFATDGRAIAD